MKGARRRAVAVAVLTVTAVAVPVLWLTGGLQKRPERPVRQPGEPLDVGLFELTVRDARVVSANAALGGGTKRFLVVRMTVVNNRHRQCDHHEQADRADRHDRGRRAVRRRRTPPSQVGKDGGVRGTG